jgi:hypothetical protein
MANDTKMNLYKKLLEVRKSVDYLQKSTEGKQFNYTSSSQVLSSVRSAMNEHGILLLAQINSTRLSENITKSGTVVYFTELDMTMTWVDVETGETIVLPWYAQGVDLAGEKGVGKALTYAEKYFILKQFNIPTDRDDPDAFQEKHTPVDVKANLIEALVKTDSLQFVADTWTNNIKLQSDKDFKKACMEAKKRLKPEKEAEPKEPVAPAPAGSEGAEHEQAKDEQA